MRNNVCIIAEAGVNHNGELELAKALIDKAAAAGADYVKFQTFKTENLVSKEARQAEYQKKNNKSGEEATQYEMLKKLELSHQDHLILIDHCRSRNIKFLSTAFDLESIELLLSLGIDLFKIPSGEITNLPYLKKIGGLKKKVILSTGMSIMEEIKEAVEVLVKAGTRKEDISVLHCTTDYPTAMKDVNLNAMLSIRDNLSLPVGYSDHTLGIEVPVAAVALGATIIEKHFTLDRNLPGPDHLASLEPEELKSMVSAIRNIEQAMGSFYKQPTEAETKNRIVARKSIHLAQDLKKGDVIREQDLILTRPGDGISGMEYENVLGKQARMDLLKGSKLKWEEIE